MHELPHYYRIALRAEASGPATASAAGLDLLTLAPPAAFDGPGDRWSPEELLVAAVASCFVFTFRAIAAASKISFSTIECAAEGILDRVEGGLAFSAIALKVKITAPPEVEHGRIERVAHKAEQSCLVSRSLKAPVQLEVEVLASS
ncbi:MAG: OsmC family protein [Deltaproteobacteria bacterium]|nr:OsmC family protein [Deltaproteobacteria bacterium]